MKRRFFKQSGLLLAITAVAVVIGFTGCKKEDPTIPTLPSLEVNYDANPVGASLPQLDVNGGTRIISVKSNRAWTISIPAAAGWVTATPSSGAANSGFASVTLTIAENTGELRSTSVTVKTTDGDKSVVFNVSQKGSAPQVDNKPIADFRDEYLTAISSAENQTLALTEKVIFMGTVVSDKAGKNIEDYLFAIQDGTAPHSGVVINFNNHTANLGDLVIVTCEAGRKAKLFNNLLQIEATDVDVYSGSGEAYEPIAVTSATLRDYESQLVKIVDVQSQSDATGQTWSGSKVFVNEAGDAFTSYVKTAATFASAALDTGKGYLIGLSGVFGATVQIQPRNADDTKFLKGTRFETTVPEDGKNIIFREDMGAENVPSPYLNVNAFTKWTRFGPGAANVTYSTPTATDTKDASVRYALTQVSSYEGASGGNNIFFGNLPGDKIFIISGIETFGLTDLLLGFGLNNTSANVAAEWSSDGTTWNNIEFTKTSTVWGYTVVPFTVPSSVTSISLRFRTAIDSTVRLDDVTVSTNSDIPEAPASFSVSPTAANVSASGGEMTFDVTGNVDWTVAVTEGSEYLESGSPTPTSGTGADDVSVVFKANTDPSEKIVKILVSTEADVTTKSYEVVFTQAAFAYTFGVSSESVAVTASGGAATVNVTGNVGWTAAVTAGIDNLVSDPGTMTGTGAGTVTLNFKENTETSVKTVTVRISTTESITPNFYDVVFTQAAFAYTFGVSSESVAVTASAGTATVDVTGNVDWTAAVTAGIDNLVSDPGTMTGTGAGTVSLNFKENTDTDNTKSVTVRISTTASITPNFYDVVFTQAAASATGEKMATFDFSVLGAGWPTSGSNPLTGANATFTSDDVTLTFARGTHTSTDPSGISGLVRMYSLKDDGGGNQLTVATSSGVITNIEFTYGGTIAASVSASTGTLDSSYSEWTGSDASVVFSIYSTSTTTNQQRHIAKVVVTYE